MKKIVKKHDIHAATIHLDLVPKNIIHLLCAEGIPLVIENMDRRKKNEKDPENIVEWGKKYNLPFVLDLQHAYENAIDQNVDPVMFTKKLTEAMLANGGISHLHVSGEISDNGVQKNNHALVHMATNQDIIIKMLQMTFKTVGGMLPIILEGDPFNGMSGVDVVVNNIQKEIAFLKDVLR